MISQIYSYVPLYRGAPKIGWHAIINDKHCPLVVFNTNSRYLLKDGIFREFSWLSAGCELNRKLSKCLDHR